MKRGLNDSQKQHLLANCQYADKLLSDVESILSAAQSKSVFPKYTGGLTPPQRRVVEDYIARIRSQILSALQSQGIPLPRPVMATAHSVKVALTFAGIALEECTADKMRGYGEVPSEVVSELNGLVNEIKGLLEQLSGYLGQNVDQDPRERLKRLSQTGGEIELLKRLATVISEQGLVDYRGRLSAILDRAESKNFEIALFGRVSSGKSSLLNHMAGFDLLPVGVTPITAVPTRIVFGATPRLLVRTAGQSERVYRVDDVAEFVTEQQNSGNTKRVERLVVEFPSERLKDRVVLVDTPGLGSLATAGASETLAYLPRCDLGVVLMDAGSTLTMEDVSTVQALFEAAINTTIVLSKADLLEAGDIRRMKEYIGSQIRSHLGLEVQIHAVSIAPGFTHLLDDWFTNELAPLYERHRELTQESLRRKIGALRDSVTGALRVRLDRAAHPGSPVLLAAPELAEAENDLRRVTGRFEEVRQQWFRDTLQLRDYGPKFLEEAASRIVERWHTQDAPSVISWEMFEGIATTISAAKASGIRVMFEDLARDLGDTLRKVSNLLGEDSAVVAEELTGVIKEMPRIDMGPGELELRQPWVARLSPALAKRSIEGVLRERVGDRVNQSFATFGSMLDAWSKRTSDELRLRFNGYADALRAQLALTSQRNPAGGNVSEIRAALQELETCDALSLGAKP
jgi:GTP-binding protein EngB required for normal cell division